MIFFSQYMNLRTTFINNILSFLVILKYFILKKDAKFLTAHYQTAFKKNPRSMFNGV